MQPLIVQLTHGGSAAELGAGQPSRLPLLSWEPRGARFSQQQLPFLEGLLCARL